MKARTITAFQNLLHNQFAKIEGLQDTKSKACGFDVVRHNFVQVLNVSNSHWVTVAAMGCELGTVNWYDTGQPSLSPINRIKKDTGRYDAMCEERNSHQCHECPETKRI